MKITEAQMIRLCLVAAYSAMVLNAQDAWTVHDRNRPNPPVVAPGPQSGGAPADAIVLFDGHGLDQFESQTGGPVSWQAEAGYFVVKPGSGSIQTKRSFGDCQIHAEWASPNPPQGTDQMRGNSGLIIMGLYELQVLDSYGAKTYADGQAGAIYGQYPPLVNATRAPGEWQTYDVIFREPRFDSTGHLVSRARETVLLNGIVVQDSSELSGPTAYHNRPAYFPLPERLPLVLQDHGTPVRYRNLWIRDLAPLETPLPVKSFVPLKVDSTGYQNYLGDYENAEARVNVSFSDQRLVLKTVRTRARDNREITDQLDLTPMSDDAFVGRGKPGADLTSVIFTRTGGREGAVGTVVLFQGGSYVELKKK